MPHSRSHTTRVLLVKPAVRTSYGYPATPPLGIGQLATILRQDGHDAAVLDLRAKGYGAGMFLRRLRERRPDIVGFSVSSFEYPAAIELCRMVKLFDATIITVLGGPHPTMSPERSLEHADVDYLCIGEADCSFSGFVSAFPDRVKMRSVAGIGSRDAGGTVTLNAAPEPVMDLDSLPSVDFSLFDLDAYRVRGQLTLPLFTSRGCPYGCIYCVSRLVHGKRCRGRSPRSLVDEMERNCAVFGTSSFTILDDTFNFDPDRVAGFCAELMNRRPGLSWDCVQGIRADRATPEMFRLMKQAGCRQVAIGVESGDERVLSLINKGESLDQIRSAIAAANAAGLMTKGFFIVGSPGETAETVQRSVEFFKDNRITIPRFSMIVAYPGTELDQWVRANARPFFDAYEYVTTHSELEAADVQFETGEFPRDERIRMFKYAEREADIWLIRNKLTEKFGPRFGRILAGIFEFRICREALKLAFRMNLISVYS